MRIQLPLESTQALQATRMWPLSFLAMAATIFLCYRFAARMVRVLGASGINVLVRLSAFILLCIGIQIIWSGVSALTGLPSR